MRLIPVPAAGTRRQCESRDRWEKCTGQKLSAASCSTAHEQVWRGNKRAQHRVHALGRSTTLGLRAATRAAAMRVATRRTAAAAACASVCSSAAQALLRQQLAALQRDRHGVSDHAKQILTFVHLCAHAVFVLPQRSAAGRVVNREHSLRAPQRAIAVAARRLDANRQLLQHRALCVLAYGHYNRAERVCAMRGLRNVPAGVQQGRQVVGQLAAVRGEGREDRLERRGVRGGGRRGGRPAAWGAALAAVSRPRCACVRLDLHTAERSACCLYHRACCLLLSWHACLSDVCP